MFYFSEIGGTVLAIDYTSSHWDNFLYISSADTSLNFLLTVYEKSKIKDAQTKSYENCYSLIYYIEQGMSFFTQAEKSPINIKPILLFYGYVFLLKACLLTVDPNYPESSTVLAHGVSTRKRKKQNYQYLRDEVRIQKNGLFPHLSDKMFHMKHLEGEKMPIEYLLQDIPELAEFFKKWSKRNLAIPLKKENDSSILITDDILDHYKMTAERFIQYLSSKSKLKLSTKQTSSGLWQIQLPSTKSFLEILPFRFNIIDKNYYLLKNSKDLAFYPELSIHYLILYHLSMIARYEIDWWAEMIHHKPSVEYPLIVQYLNLVQTKIPFLVNQYLFEDLGR
jgi:YaaC-like protein